MNSLISFLWFKYQLFRLFLSVFQRFFFKSQVIATNKFNIEKCEDFVWVTKDELIEYFPEQAEFLKKMIISWFNFIFFCFCIPIFKVKGWKILTISVEYFSWHRESRAGLDAHEIFWSTLVIVSNLLLFNFSFWFSLSICSLPYFMLQEFTNLANLLDSEFICFLWQVHDR